MVRARKAQKCSGSSRAEGALGSQNDAQGESRTQTCPKGFIKTGGQCLT